MSQQTRIDVVVDYFKRWMKEFPDIETLANAPLERVNEVWTGLGYYRRAKFLHLGAQQVMRDFHGQLPNDVQTLRSIRGIGPYTAGAIGSIAFGIHTPCVDGNVERVLSRLRPAANMESNDKAVSNPKRLKKSDWWALATQIHEVSNIEDAIDAENSNLWPGDLNQALMELGATVCKPRAAAECGKCPLLDTGICGAASLAEAQGLPVEEYGSFVARYPTALFKRKAEKNLKRKDEDDENWSDGNDREKAKRQRVSSKGVKVRNEKVYVAVAWTGGDVEDRPIRVLIVQRPQNGLLGGLWESVNVVMKTDNEIDDCKRRVREKIEGCSGRINDESMMSCGEVVHIFSHIRQRLTVDCVQVDEVLSMEGESKDGRRYRWLTGAELGEAAISTQMKKVLMRGLAKVGVKEIEKWGGKKGAKQADQKGF